jgi:hypothetical protein
MARSHGEEVPGWDAVFCDGTKGRKGILLALASLAFVLSITTYQQSAVPIRFPEPKASALPSCRRGQHRRAAAVPAT